MVNVLLLSGLHVRVEITASICPHKGIGGQRKCLLLKEVKLKTPSRKLAASFHSPEMDHLVIFKNLRSVLFILGGYLNN